MTMLIEPLFTNLFPSADKSDWLAQVRKELKDEHAYERLRWHTDTSTEQEGFTLEPYYTSEDLSGLPLHTIQNAQKQTPGWLNVPVYKLTADPKADNAVLRDTLDRGVDAVVLHGSAQHSTDMLDSATLSRLLNGIKLSDTPFFFQLTDQVDAFVRALQVVAPYQLKGGLFADPLAHWATTGVPFDEGLNALAEATRQTANSPQFRTITVSSHVFHNAGATPTQELAFLLASLADQYDYLTDAGLSIETLMAKTILSVSVGTSYFTEIAKLRALRVLAARFGQAYGLVSYQPFVHVQTSTFYDATTTPYTNLLRATTESLAAVIGGCDALTTHRYDAVLGQQSEYSDRIARNISLLLKDESYLDKVADSSAGSYYVENLTHQLVEAAWTFFIDVEKRGGFVQAFAAGFVQDEIEQAYQNKVKTVQQGKVLVGVTKFRFDETPVTNLPHDATNSRTKSVAGLALLPDRRLAELFE